MGDHRVVDRLPPRRVLALVTHAADRHQSGGRDELDQSLAPVGEHDLVAGATIEGAVRRAKRVFTVAQQVGGSDDPEDPQCAGVVRNPFHRIDISAYRYEQRPANVDFKRSLTYDEVKAIARKVPGWAEAAIWVGTYAMLRGGELLALNRRMVTWPTKPEHRGQAVIRLSHTIDKKGRLKPWGKTTGSTGVDVWIPRDVTDILASHMRDHRSTPDPERCPACAGGKGEHRDADQANPHQHCDFADDAPLFVMESTKRRCTVNYFSRWVFNKAVHDLGLDTATYRPTLHSLRMTGANLRLEAGQQFEIVRLQGRWSLGSTLFDWYVRPTREAILDGNERLNSKIRASLGIDDGATEILEDELDRLRLLVEAKDREIEALRIELRTGEQPKRGTGGLGHEGRRRITAERLRVVLAQVDSLAAAARLLGVAPSGKNYKRMREIAAENGIPIPSDARKAKRRR